MTISVGSLAEVRPKWNRARRTLTRQRLRLGRGPGPVGVVLRGERFRLEIFEAGEWRPAREPR